MSLLDAILLDPVRINTWFAVRTDGNRGSGTQSDPYNSMVCDEVMASLSSKPPVCIHLGPGGFNTAGYYEGTSVGWQPHPGMKIVGSGIDVTTLKVTGAQDPGSGTRHYWAIGHDLGSGGSSLDFFEVSDLTIDCDLANQGSSAIAIGGVRVLGSFARVRRVKVVNWGTRSSNLTCLVLAMITADPDVSTDETKGMSIEECILIDPYEGLAPLPTNPGMVNVLHVGLKADPAANFEGEGIAPVIRNCYVDCGKFATLNPAKNPLDFDIRALVMGACQGGVVEGNEIHHVRIGGPYAEKSTIASIIVRDNSYHNVRTGIILMDGQKSGTTIVLNSLVFTSSGNGYEVTATTSSDHNLKLGERVELVCSPSSLDGLFRVTEIVDQTNFKYFSPGPTASLTSGTLEKVFGTGKVIVEANAMQLGNESDGDVAVQIDDDALASQTPDHVHGEVIIRQNAVSYVDEVFDGGYTGIGIHVRGAKNLNVQNNVVDVQPANPLQDLRCGSVKYFNNQKPDGTLIRGYKDDTDQLYNELETDAEDALVLALFNRR